MNKRKKPLAGMLALFVLMCLFAGCKSGPGEESGKTDGGPGEKPSEAQEQATEKNAADYLPAADYAGYEFKVVAIPNTSYDGAHTAFDIEAESGDLIEDAVYKRNRIVEQRYNIKIAQIEESTWEKCIARFQKSVKAGSDDFDMCTLISREAWKYAIEGYVAPVSSLPYLDITQPWYARELNSELSVAGKLLFAYSDECLNMFEQTLAVFFSKKLSADLGIENIYALVRDGKWTFDKFFGFSRQAVADLNGDGQWTDEDRYGVVSQTDMFYPCFWVSGGSKTVGKDENGNLIFAGSTDKMHDIVEQVQSFVTGGQKVVYDAQADKFATIKGAGPEPDRDVSTQQFANGLALFYVRNIGIAQPMRGMEMDFGIVPFPKYDELQDKYYSRMIDGWINVVPVTNQELERTSVIMEAIACESRNLVFPAYYDLSLKTKLTRDDESEEMLDIIKDYRTLDIGDTVMLSDGIRSMVTDVMKKSGSSLAGAIEKNMGKIEKALQKVNDAAAELE